MLYMILTPYSAVKLGSNASEEMGSCASEFPLPCILVLLNNSMPVISISSRALLSFEVITHLYSLPFLGS